MSTIIGFTRHKVRPVSCMGQAGSNCANRGVMEDGLFAGLGRETQPALAVVFEVVRHTINAEADQAQDINLDHGQSEPKQVEIARWNPGCAGPHRDQGWPLRGQRDGTKCPDDKAIDQH